jgi:hypothetical protein
MTIDRETLTVKQKTIFDMWLLVPGRTPDDEGLEKLLGIVAKPKSRIRREVTEVRAAIHREAELVVKHLQMKRIPHITVCLNCTESFSTDYEYNKHCSEECLRRTIEKQGIKWNPDKTPEERWQAEQIPSIIAPASLKVLLPILEQKANEIDFSNSPFVPPVKEVPLSTFRIEDDPFADII